MSWQPPTDNLANSRAYAITMLLAVILGAVAQAFMAPPITWLFEKSRGQAAAMPSPTPAPAPNETSSPRSRQNVCGVWVSSTSRKRYDFVCQGQDSFEIYEVSDGGLNKNGAGKLTEDGYVEADLISRPKDRRARLRLKLSADGRTMEGTWQGDDPRESGQLRFHRA